MEPWYVGVSETRGTCNNDLVGRIARSSWQVTQVRQNPSSRDINGRRRLSGKIHAGKTQMTQEPSGWAKELDKKWNMELMGWGFSPIFLVYVCLPVVWWFGVVKVMFWNVYTYSGQLALRIWPIFFFDLVHMSQGHLSICPRTRR